MNALATYLHDHLAGADFAIESMERMQEKHKDEALRVFLAEMLVEVRKDRNTLQTVADRVGAGSNGIKQMTAWLGEKVSRMKLGATAEDPFATFEALEFLALGVLGKLHLWRALEVVTSQDLDLGHIGLAELVARAEAQHAEIEKQRIIYAATALR